MNVSLCMCCVCVCMYLFFVTHLYKKIEKCTLNRTLLYYILRLSTDAITIKYYSLFPVSRRLLYFSKLYWYVFTYSQKMYTYTSIEILKILQLVHNLLLLCSSCNKIFCTTWTLVMERTDVIKIILYMCVCQHICSLCVVLCTFIILCLISFFNLY